jgi:hypothetical protein
MNTARLEAAQARAARMDLQIYAPNPDIPVTSLKQIETQLDALERLDFDWEKESDGKTICKLYPLEGRVEK